MDWQGRNVLITGGAGQIGSHLAARLVALGANIRIADNLWRGRISNLYADGQPIIDLDHEVLKTDLIEYGSCVNVTRNVDTVFHLADVVAGINYVFGNQLSLFNTNVVLNSHMLKAAIENSVPNYIYVGSACSYPRERQMQLNPPPFREADAYPASPESSYGWSKLMGEYECGLAQQEALLNIGILRFHNVYGPHCELSPERSQVIPALIRKAIRYPKEPFVVWGSGEQRRAFVYVRDVVDALVSVRESGMNRGVIQIGPDYSTSIRTIAEKIVKMSGKPIAIEYDVSRPEGDMDRTADWTRAREILNWRPSTAIDQGLQLTYQWCEMYLHGGCVQPSG
jgi:GDP-D-mannose 3', 5'-epimerase